MEFRIKPKSCLNHKKSKDGVAVLQFPIQHGDMVIMHGTEIHRHYDVSLLSSVKLMFLIMTIISIKFHLMGSAGTHSPADLSDPRHWITMQHERRLQK